MFDSLNRFVRPCFCFAFVWCVALPLAAKDLSQLRVWRDLQGRSVSASLVQLDEELEAIEFLRADGLTFKLALSELSEPDQQLLRDFQQKRSSSLAGIEVTDLRPNPEAETELPEKHMLSDVPMVKQFGNFCVPASASMIAGFHGIDSDQTEIAQLSSAGSISNQGTYPSDMLLAMNKLGFSGRLVYWQSPEEFDRVVLPQIREALLHRGPVYISFEAGVFGAMGHGCVITGYNHRRQELYFNNPWGNTFEKDYEAVAFQARGIVIIDPPLAAPVASEAFISKVKTALPRFSGSIFELQRELQRIQLDFELIWCSRQDARDDKKFAKDTARDEGRKILEMAFERNPAVLIPYSPKYKTESYFLITRPPEGGANFLVYELNASGWSAPESKNLGRLTRNWTTEIELTEPPRVLWELPMLELRE